MTNTNDEDVELFRRTLSELAPEARVRSHQFRGAVEVLKVLDQVIAVVSNIGGSLALCAAARAFLKERPRYAIDVSYVDGAGATRAARYDSATIDDLARLLEAHGPKYDEGILIRLVAQ
jgi:hypothetical protein